MNNCQLLNKKRGAKKSHYLLWWRFTPISCSLREQLLKKNLDVFYFRHICYKRNITPFINKGIFLEEQVWRRRKHWPPTNVVQVRFPDSAICGLSLLWVLVLAPRGFSPGTPVLPSPQKPTSPNFNSIWIIVKHFIMIPWLGRLRKHFPRYWN